nr:immunoglobulin light chain junction region [Macaca mulatta]
DYSCYSGDDNVF